MSLDEKIVKSLWCFGFWAERNPLGDDEAV